jgi:hypothetical protein
VSGETVVVGAPNEGTTAQGAAYVFVEPPVGWSGTLTETARLLPSDPAATGNFGTSIASSGKAVLVGKIISRSSDAGAVCFFNQPDDGWSGTLTERNELFASDGQVGDRFGFAVGLSDQAFVVGAIGDDASRGSAYVFSSPDALFLDGFESGNTSAWSSSVQ